MMKVSTEYVAVVRSLSVPAWLMTGGGAVLYGNDRLADLLGRADLDPGEPASAFCLATCGLALDDLRQRALAEGRAQSGCLGFRTAGGGGDVLRTCRLTLLSDRGPGVLLAELGPPSALPGCLGPAEPDEVLSPADHYRVMQESAGKAGYGSWYMDLASRRYWASDSLYQLLGYRPGEVTVDDDWIRASIHPEDRELAVAAREDLLQGRCSSIQAEYRMRRRDGRYRWFSAAVRHETGASHPPLLCGTLVDIDLRKTGAALLQQALRDAEAARTEAERNGGLLGAATAFARVVAWYFDPATGLVQYASPPRADLGYPDEPLVQPIAVMRDDVHPEDAAAVAEAMEAVVTGRALIGDVDYRKRHRDGRWLWFNSRASALMLGAQQRLVCGVTVDISPRKEAEERLRAAVADAGLARDEAEATRRRLQDRVRIERIALENSHVVPWYVVPSTGERWCGSHLLTMLGYPPQDSLVMSRIPELMHPDDVAMVQAEFDAMMTGRAHSIDHDFRLRHADGSWLWIGSKAKAVGPGEDGPAMVGGCFYDITERKASEARLAEALAAAERAREETRAQEELLSLAARCGEMGAWRIDLADGSAWMQDEGFRQLGYEPGEFTPDLDGWLSLVHPEDRHASWRSMLDLLRGTSEVFDREMRFRHKQGGYHWYRSIGRKIDRSDQGLAPMIAGAHTRIDELKENERRLADALSESRRVSAEAAMRQEILNLTSQAGQIGHFSVISETEDGWAPDQTYRLLGYDPGEFPSRDEAWRSLFHPEDLPLADSRMQAMICGEIDVFDVESRLRHKDGSYHWYRCVARMVDRSAEGLMPMRAGAVFNIDEAKSNERKLSEAAATAQRAIDRLNRMADNAPGALFEYLALPDGRMEFKYFSAALPDLVGATPAELQADGRVIYRHIPPEDQKEAKARVSRAREALTAFEVRHRINHPTRGLRYLLVKALPHTDAQGVTTWFGNTLDVTAELETEQRATEAAEALRTAHQRLSTIADKSPSALFELCVYPNGRSAYRYFNLKLPDMVGVDAERLREDALATFRYIPQAEATAITSQLYGGADRRPVQFECRMSLDHPRRGLRWILCTASPFLHPDGQTVWYGNLLDITERLEIEYRAAEAAAEMRRAHDRLSMIADIAPVGLFEFRRFADGTIDFPFMSGRFADMMGGGFEEDEDNAQNLFDRIDPLDLPNFLNSIDDSARNISPWKTRFRLHHPDRGVIWLSITSLPRKEPDRSIVWTGAIHDVTTDVLREAELRRAHQLAEQMRADNERQALHDGLTGLPNRRYYDNMMASRFDYARSSNVRDCVLIRVDLDHFKYVNDTLGHEAGDLVLKRVAEVLGQCLRGEDFAARIGGDEFSIILAPGMDDETAREVVERIQTRLAEPLAYEGRLCRFGASFGIAHTEDMTALGPELQLFADAALYKAKESGRNRMEFFTPDLHRGILNDRRLATEIHAGLERDEFVPYFQPQISAKDGRLTGIETLLRWNHPEKGVLVPGDFMHVAEQLRVVPEIDRIMMVKSREALARWRAQGLAIPKISFNVSSGRMHDPDVVSMARSIAQGETKVAFELLESILVEEESDAFKFHVDKIREAGIEIEIDDFGSGHASIIGLMEIAPTALKIDRRIVAPVARDRRSRNLLRAIVEIAETLGIRTVAEGVETEEQVGILRAAGVDVLQGYIYSRPLCETDLASYCRAAIAKSA